MQPFKFPGKDLRQAMNIRAKNLRDNISSTASIVTEPFTMDLLTLLEGYVKELRTIMEDLESSNAEQSQTTQEKQEEQEFCPRCFSSNKSDRRQVTTRLGVSITCSNDWHFKARDLDAVRES